MRYIIGGRHPTLVEVADARTACGHLVKVESAPEVISRPDLKAFSALTRSPRGMQVSDTWGGVH